MRLAHDRPGRLFLLVVLGRGGTNHIPRELVDRVAQVLLLFGQFKTDHGAASINATVWWIGAGRA